MHIRQAHSADADTLGQLVFSSAPALLSSIFDITPDLTALKFLQHNLSYADGQYGYENHWVVEIEGAVVGCISAWHANLPKVFHQATLSNLNAFYGIQHAVSVMQSSQVLQGYIPKPLENEYCIGHFAVFPQYQNQGVGSALLTFAGKQALSLGKSVLSLDVQSNNSSAVDFYLSKGFAKDNHTHLSASMQGLEIDKFLHLTKGLI